MKIETIVQSGHYLPINDLAFSPDGRLLATCGADESVRLWDVAAGCEAAVLRGHTGPLYKVRFSPDGRLLASCGWDHTVRLWETETRRCLHTLEREVSNAHMGVNCVAFSPSGRYVAAGGMAVGKRPTPVCIWETASGALSRRFEVAQGVHGIAFSPDESVVVVSGYSDDYRIGVHEVATGNELLSLSEEEGPEAEDVSSPVPVAVWRDGRTLLIGRPGEVGLFDLALREETDRLPVGGNVYDLSTRADGTLLVAGSEGFSVWDVGARKKLEEIAVKARRLSPDRRLLARADGRHLELIDRETGRVIRRLGTQLELPQTSGNMQRQFALAADPLLPVIASAAPDGLVRLWDLRSGGGPKTVKAHRSSIEVIAFHPYGELLATAGDDGVNFWRVADGSLVREVPFEGGVRALAFSWDGTWLVVAQRNLVASVETDSGEVLATASFPDTEVLAVATAPYGKECFVGTFDQLFIWRPTRSEQSSVMKDTLPLGALAFGADGTLAIAAGYNKWMGSNTRGVVSLLNPAVGFARNLQGHAGEVRAIAFGPDGDAIATGGADGKLVLWDVEGGEERFKVEAHAGDVTGVAFTSDGRFVASIGLDSALRLWDTASGKLAATLISLNEEDYVAVTDEGFYSATKAGLRSVMFRLDGRIFPFEQFDLQLNRPDRVLSRLGFAADDLVAAYAQAHERRMKQLGFAASDPSELEGFEPPRVEFLTPPPVGVSAERHIKLRVALHSPRRPLDRLHVYCNDVPVRGRAGVDLSDLGSGGELDVEVELASGDNKVQLCAADAGGVESRRETFRVVYVDPERKPNLYVMTVGVSRYARPSYDLEYAAKDARDLEAELKRLQRRFGNVESLVLADERATRGAILEGRAFLERTRVDDHVVILFAGHGTLEGADYFFLPTDFDPESLADTAVSYEEIQGLLDGIPARRRLILLDTCHSGEPEELPAPTERTALGPDVHEVRSFRHFSLAPRPKGAQRDGRVNLLERLPDLFADLRRDSGAYVIAAAGAAEYAREFGELKNGVFTSTVIQGLREGTADRNADGLITVSELHRFVTQSVAALTGGLQRPISRRENLADDFPVL
ncbi:MAG: caspase family protein [Acidobacteria bacterium]|nr:caspase family protein [Acidobacteriota bacterium]